MQIRRGGMLVASAVALALGAFASQSAERPWAGTQWWAPGDAQTLAVSATYANEYGRLGIVSAAGEVDTRGHPFFEPIGTNGRACVTCHQPADAMSLSLDSIRARWEETDGRDPLFAAIDGQNCPHL